MKDMTKTIKKIVVTAILVTSCSGKTEDFAQVDCNNMAYRQPPLMVPRKQPGPLNSKGSPQWGQNIVLQNVFTGATPNLTIPREVLKLENVGTPRIMTLHTGLFNDSQPAESYQLIGQLQYGSGGGIQTVEFDWLNGMQLTFPADSLKLGCFINGVFGAAAVIPTEVSISALISNGPGCGRAIGAQRSFSVQITAGNALFIQIPDKARRVLIYDPANLYSALVTINGLTSSGGSGTFSFTAAEVKTASINGQGIVLPGSTASVAIINGAAVTISYWVVFLLDL